MCNFSTIPTTLGRTLQSDTHQFRRLSFTCMRYIELTPVRASMVSDPSDYAWSSYHQNAPGQASDLLVPHPEYLRLGNSNEARQSY
jgi:hypothetical protein